MRRLLAPLLAAALLGAPGVAAADPAACPPGVAETTGTNPTYQQVADVIEDVAVEDGQVRIPVAILRAIAYQESRWTQYDPATGKVIVSRPKAEGGDDVCGVGIMQVTAAADDDPMRLATDYAYNIAAGARILREKWALSIAAGDPQGGEEDDPLVMENWFYAVCLYNGCGTDQTYPNRIAETVADPFRRVTVAALKPYMPIHGFTKPTEVKPDYTLPNAFQARLGEPGTFVFYDHTTGVVTETVEAYTHRITSPSPDIAYGHATFGPDGLGGAVTCPPNQCAAWRLAEGKGLAGRAHWTNSVTGAVQTAATYAPKLPRTGPYRVSAYVPDLGVELGTARYEIAGTTVPLDQEMARGGWAPLGDRTLTPSSTVRLTDVGDVAGQRLVLDAIRIQSIPVLTMTSAVTALTYGATTTVTTRLTHGGAGVGSVPVTVARRNVGTTAWTTVGSYVTRADGTVPLAVKPTRNVEYRATLTDPSWVAATSNVRRINVATRVTGGISRTSAPRGTRVTISATVAPNHAGQQVVLQRLVSGVWRNVAPKTLSATSRASFVVAPSTRGTYYYRLYKPADADHIGGVSARLTLKVT